MTVFIALLRAVNVGGTGKLAMSDLKAICEQAGCKKVKTYIASGNLVFSSGKTEAQVKALIEALKAVPAPKKGSKGGDMAIVPSMAQRADSEEEDGGDGDEE